MWNKVKHNPLIVIVLTVFVDLLGFSIVIPILAPLLALPYTSQILPTTSYNQRLIVLGFLVASYPIAQFIAAPIIGQLSDRYGRKPLLAISLIGTLIARIIFIYGIVTNNIFLLFASRIVDGVTGGNISVAQSAIADISTPQNKAKNFGLIGAAFGLGFIIGPYLGGRLGDAATVAFFGKFLPSWIASSSTLPLWCATILCAINIIFLFAIFPETLKEKIKRKLTVTVAFTNTLKAFKLEKLRTAFITIFLFTIGFTFFTQFLSVYIQNKFEPEIRQAVEQKLQTGKLSIVIPEQINKITIPQVRSQAISDYTTKITDGYFQAEAQTRSSDVFSYIGLWVVISQGFLTRKLGKRFKSSTLLKVGLLVNAIAAFVFLIPDRIDWLYFIIPIFAISNGLIQPNISAIISNSADKESQGEVLGGNQSVQSLAQAIPPIVSGYVTAVALSAPILLSAGFTFMAFVIFAIFFKEQKHEILHES